MFSRETTHLGMVSLINHDSSEVATWGRYKLSMGHSSLAAEILMIFCWLLVWWKIRTFFLLYHNVYGGFSTTILLSIRLYSINLDKLAIYGWWVRYIGRYTAGWWYTYPSGKYEFVSWDDDIPNWMEK